MREVSRLADTLVVDPSQLENGVDLAAARADVLRTIRDGLTSAKFTPCEEETLITIPFVFD